MADAVVAALGKTFDGAALRAMSVADLALVMDDLDRQREAARAQGRAVGAVLAEKLHHEAVVAKLAGLSEAEVARVLDMAGSDPAALKAAVEKSRAARSVLEVTADRVDVGVAPAGPGAT